MNRDIMMPRKVHVFKMVVTKCVANLPMNINMTWCIPKIFPKSRYSAHKGNSPQECGKYFLRFTKVGTLYHNLR